MRRIKREKSLAHRLFILFIILLLPTFFIREYRLIKSKKETRILPAEDFSGITLAPVKDKNFTFMVLVKDNASSIRENFDSIQSQKYEKFQVIYLDRGSTDETVEILKEVSKQHDVSIIECEKDYEAYEKYYECISSLPDDQVIIHLYGTDWLAHDEVLLRLSQSYKNPDVWLTYGQYLDYPSYQKGLYEPKPKKTLYKKRVQKAPWVIAPLKTFYAGLFKKLHVEAGFFLSIEDENALLIPMAELAKSHVRFIPDVLFIHNEITTKRRSSRRLTFMGDRIRARVGKTIATPSAELLIFSDNTPSDLKQCILSCQKHLSGVTQIHVIYECSDTNAPSYEKLKRTFPKVLFTKPLSYGEANFKQTVTHSIWGNGRSSPYVILSTDQVEVKKAIALPLCVEAMRKTRAYGFYFHLGKEAEKGVYSWNIQKGTGAFRYPDALQMALYRRLDLEKEIQKLSFQSIGDLIEVWADHSPDYRVGLSFEKARVSTFSSKTLTQS